MKNTFKKSLLAVTVAGISAAAIADADLDTSALIGISTDGQLGATQSSGTVTATLGAEYTAGDIIKLNFSGASLDTNSVSAPTGGDLTLGVLESDESGVTYRVVSTSANTSGDKIDFGTFSFDSDELAASGVVSATYSAETSTGVSLDSGKNNSATLIVSAGQLVATVQRSGRLNGTANISYDRFLFTDNSATDKLTFTIGGSDGVYNDEDVLIAPFSNPATITEAMYTVSGDFSWVVDTNENVEGIQADSDTFTVDCSAGSLKSGSFEVESDQVSFVCEGMSLSTSYAFPSLTMDLRQGESSTFALNPIPTTSFNASIDYKATAAAESEYSSSVYAGAWTLNAAEAFVNYMPYGPNISQIVYITNTGSKTGAITVNVYDENGEVLVEGLDAGMATAGGVTKITGQITDAIGDFNGKARIEITVDAPQNDIEVYSAYNVGGSDRGYVNNSTN